MIEPASHSYLGNNMEDIRKRHMLEVNNTYEILLLPMRDIVLFPGETLPLRMHNPDFLRELRKLFDTKMDIYGHVQEVAQHIGIVNTQHRHTITTIVSAVGTTVEIRTKSKENLNLPNEHEEVILTGKGRHRFKVMNVRRSGQVLFATVIILREDHPNNFQFERLDSGMKSCQKWVYLCNHPSVLARRAYQLTVSSKCGDNFDGSMDQNVVLRWGPSSDGDDNTDGTYEPQDLTSEQTMQVSITRAELDPVGFSFFLAANMPLRPEYLQRLLEARDVIDRLRLLLDYMQSGREKHSLACAQCGECLADRSDIFSVPGAEGVVGAYVNPHGAVHQTVTVRKLSETSRVQLHGPPCTEDSWFPGYAWTIAYCGRCFAHLGWRFTLVGRGADGDDTDEHLFLDDMNSSGDNDSNSGSYSSFETAESDWNSSSGSDYMDNIEGGSGSGDGGGELVEDNTLMVDTAPGQAHIPITSTSTVVVSEVDVEVEEMITTTRSGSVNVTDIHNSQHITTEFDNNHALPSSPLVLATTTTTGGNSHLSHHLHSGQVREFWGLIRAALKEVSR